uniref:Uncharacterized protein n=1 Tax=Anguilla anguilla TaxID=7936 RepID=A0A0E9QMM2_ANGAN
MPSRCDLPEKHGDTVLE